MWTEAPRIWVCLTHPESEEHLLITAPMRVCELLVGQPDVNVNGVGDWPQFLRIAITTRALRHRCPG